MNGLGQISLGAEPTWLDHDDEGKSLVRSSQARTDSMTLVKLSWNRAMMAMEETLKET